MRDETEKFQSVVQMQEEDDYYDEVQYSPYFKKQGAGNQISPAGNRQVEVDNIDTSSLETGGMCDDVDEGPPKTRTDTSWIEKMRERIHDPHNWEDNNLNESVSNVSRFSFK